MSQVDWGQFRAMLVTALTVALLVSTPTVTAAVGDVVRVGEVNRGDATTTLQGPSTATLRLINKTPGEEALVLSVESGPALRVNTKNRIPNLNADRLDGKHAAQLEVPSGAVMFFARGTCPAGWTVYTPARGRAVIGVPPGGTLQGATGSPLANLQKPTTTGGQHNHLWAYFDQQGKSWKSWMQAGGLRLMIDYGDGIGGEGSGYYPIAPNPVDVTGSFVVDYYTALDGYHDHTVELPYVQLLPCRKS